ncbi:Hydrogen cyanide synthase subunit HcnB [Ensifer sp. M14]|uniref:FAD-dependent oxidoreductase n=1 Tax=Ensifer sp. M14 TaxID=2203782 RepID=UPI000E2BDF65|nr:FAD-dependent oxidoreductase [Ensifer sp. M14]RDL47312.1 Hydrogen cyanide synthase subunit HcnB [Ensifer sp. M14]
MTDLDVIVVGGGPAGLAAALAIIEAGLSVELIEQRLTVGGAIFRQPIDSIEGVPQHRAVRGRWKALFASYCQSGIRLRHSCVFLGVDSDGVVLIEDRHQGAVVRLRARAVVIATGAIEKILPRPGWELSGISTAGGLQVMMKETGRPPNGRVLLAGNGPLLIAVAAQMAKLGNPPVAVVEAGDPLRHPLVSSGLFAYPRLLSEAFSYLYGMTTSRTTWLRGSVLKRVRRCDGGMEAILADRHGRVQTIIVDRVGLHDGVKPNHVGLPDIAAQTDARPIILKAGDCREALGSIAAEADGRRVARQVVNILSGKTQALKDVETTIAQQRRAQSLLSALFAPVDPASPLAALPDETILCRCEGRTVGDLRLLAQRSDGLSGREAKHNGRFSMGVCQGRFCAANVAEMLNLISTLQTPAVAHDLTGQRWPIRPVSIGALTCATSQHDSNDERGSK